MLLASRLGRALPMLRGYPTLASLALLTLTGCRPTPPPPPPLARSCPAPPPLPDRAVLASGLEPFLADLLQRRETEITARPAPFLRCGALYDVEHLGHNHPYSFHVAWLPGHPAVSLPAPERLLAFAREAGLSLDTEARRTSYVEAFLALDARYQQLLPTARDLRFTVPRELPDPRVDELLKIDPNAPVAQEVARRRHIEDALGPTFRPLRLAGAAPWGGAIHAIKKPRELVRVEVTLLPGGDVAVREVTLVTDAPVMMAWP